MLELLRRVIVGPRPPATRMNKADVLALVADKAKQVGNDSWFGMVHVRKIDGRVTWIVGTPTIGSGCAVSIDDATGMIGEFRNWGIR